MHLVKPPVLTLSQFSDKEQANDAINTEVKKMLDRGQVRGKDLQSLNQRIEQQAHRAQQSSAQNGLAKSLSTSQLASAGQAVIDVSPMQKSVSQASVRSDSQGSSYFLNEPKTENAVCGAWHSSQNELQPSSRLLQTYEERKKEEWGVMSAYNKVHIPRFPEFLLDNVAVCRCCMIKSWSVKKKNIEGSKRLLVLSWSGK